MIVGRFGQLELFREGNTYTVLDRDDGYSIVLERSEVFELIGGLVSLLPEPGEDAPSPVQRVSG